MEILFQATDALEMMLLAVLSPVVRCEWSLSDAEVAFVTTVRTIITVFIGYSSLEVYESISRYFLFKKLL